MIFQKICRISLKIFIFIFIFFLLNIFKKEKNFRRLRKYRKSRKRNLLKLLRIKKRKNKEDLDIIEIYNNSIDMPKNPNDPLIEKEREIILNKYHLLNTAKDLSITFDLVFPFGNQLAVFNKMIFYCEIIKCKNIILPKDNNLFINHTLYDKDYNITISIGDFSYGKGVDSIAMLDFYFYYSFFNFKIENRLDIIKNEVINNLPKVEINDKDLVIHFRSSDIFQHKDDPKHAPDYAQPPLCFYEKILNNYNFDKIYIISIDDIYNPVIKKLREKYKKLIYNQNKLEIDLSYIIRGYNIVGSISSFLIGSIKLNDNLKLLWEYDRYPLKIKRHHNHHLLSNIKRKYTVFLMEPSEIYKTEMVVWKNSDEQIQIMLNDDCPNDFKIIPPNK